MSGTSLIDRYNSKNIRDSLFLTTTEQVPPTWIQLWFGWWVTCKIASSRLLLCLWSLLYSRTESKQEAKTGNHQSTSTSAGKRINFQSLRCRKLVDATVRITCLVITMLHNHDHDCNYNCGDHGHGYGYTDIGWLSDNVFMPIMSSYWTPHDEIRPGELSSMVLISSCYEDSLLRGRDLEAMVYRMDSETYASGRPSPQSVSQSGMYGYGHHIDCRGSSAGRATDWSSNVRVVFWRSRVQSTVLAFLPQKRHQV